MSPVLALLLALPASAAEFAPTTALEQLAQAARQAAQSAAFPSCAPEPGYAWCPTSPDAFMRTLAPAQQAALKAALRTYLVDEVAAELRSRTAGDAVAQRHIAAFAAAAADPAVDVWRLATAANGLVAVGFTQPELDVSFPLAVDKLFPAGMSAHLRERHHGLACDAEFIVHFGRDGALKRVNPSLGNCHDAHE
jgi:hypothetical protein